MEIDPNDLTMETFFTPTFILTLSSLAFIVIVGSLLSVFLSQRLNKRHQGYNPTQSRVMISSILQDILLVATEKMNYCLLFGSATVDFNIHILYLYIILYVVV